MRTVQSAHFKTQGTEVCSPCVLPPAPLRDKNDTQLKFAPNLILLLRWIYTNHLYKKRSFIPEKEITATTMEDVMNLVQAEAFPDVSYSTTRNILALCKQLVMLVSTGKAKEEICIQLSHKQVKRLTD